MIRSGVDLELAAHLAAELVLGEHALHGTFDDGLGTTLAQRVEGFGLDAARIPGMAILDLALALARGDSHLLGVDDNNEIAAIDMRRVRGLVLAAEPGCHLGSETAEREVGRIHDVPTVFYVTRFGRICLVHGHGLFLGHIEDTGERLGKRLPTWERRICYSPAGR